MKFLLLSAALNLQITYPTETVCSRALEEVVKFDKAAFCIPAGEDEFTEKHNKMFEKMFEMITKMRKELQ